jgi:hypothetical protein
LLVFDFFMKILYYNELIGDMLCLVWNTLIKS